MRKQLILKSLFLIVSNCLFIVELWAFPENIRHGYNGCESCHVSPSGGGVLNLYGKALASELQSTWGEFSKQQQPEWIITTVDQRNVYQKNERTEKFFHMQTELEIALNPVKDLYFVGSYGQYGPYKSEMVRRFYALYRKEILGINVSYRYGKFLPNYGINIDDHTLSVKRNYYFNQGRESFNSEFTFQNKMFRLDWTEVIFENDPNKNSGLSYEKLENSVEGSVSKFSFFASDIIAIGYSYSKLWKYQWMINHGPFAKIGLSKRAYILAQYDHNSTSKNAAQTYIAGFEAVQGFHLIGGFDDKKTIIYGTKWYPIYGFEFSLQGRYTKSEPEVIWMTHLYF